MFAAYFREAGLPQVADYQVRCSFVCRIICVLFLRAYRSNDVQMFTCMFVYLKQAKAGAEVRKEFFKQVDQMIKDEASAKEVCHRLINLREGCN
jgi:hypothetical protein